jgi:hypothetical protein
MSKEELIEEILDIINSENSGLSHQQRLNEIENLLNQNKDENYHQAGGYLQHFN